MKLKVKKTSALTKSLTKPSILPQTKNRYVTDILFTSTDSAIDCVSYNIEKDAWTEAGSLPKEHKIKEHMMVQYDENQTLTLYVVIDFESNQFLLKSAINKGNVGLKPSKDQW